MWNYFVVISKIEWTICYEEYTRIEISIVETKSYLVFDLQCGGFGIHSHQSNVTVRVQARHIVGVVHDDLDKRFLDDLFVIGRVGFRVVEFHHRM